MARAFYIAALAVWLAACSNPTARFVGSWSAGDQRLQLLGDGTAIIAGRTDSVGGKYRSDGSDGIVIEVPTVLGATTVLTGRIVGDYLTIIGAGGKTQRYIRELGEIRSFALSDAGEWPTVTLTINVLAQNLSPSETIIHIIDSRIAIEEDHKETDVQAKVNWSVCTPMGRRRFLLNHTKSDSPRKLVRIGDHFEFEPFKIAIPHNNAPVSRKNRVCANLEVFPEPFWMIRESAYPY